MKVKCRIKSSKVLGYYGNKFTSKRQKSYIEIKELDLEGFTNRKGNFNFIYDYKHDKKITIEMFTQYCYPFKTEATITQDGLNVTGISIMFPELQF